MRHHTAVQIDGGWRYASLSSRGGYPLGNCGDHLHDTELEARECFAAYQRERITLDGKCSWTSCSHEGCKLPAERYASITGEGYAISPLCTEHLTVENAIIALHLTGPAGDSWQS